jgi:hypothetical protein
MVVGTIWMVTRTIGATRNAKRERDVEPVVSDSLNMGALYKHVPRDGARSTTPVRNADGMYSQYPQVTLIIGCPSPDCLARLSTEFLRRIHPPLLWRSGHSMVAIGAAIAQHSPSRAAL